jgi:hypothetical protein
MEEETQQRPATEPGVLCSTSADTGTGRKVKASWYSLLPQQQQHSFRGKSYSFLSVDASTLCLPNYYLYYDLINFVLSIILKKLCTKLV